MQQLDFLNLIESDTDQIFVTIQHLADGRYLAMIDGGWWIAYGKTEKQAVDRVIQFYQSEL